jgi:hypothetical protein
VIRNLYTRLPGPTAVRVALIAVGTLALLVLFYEWMGAMFLDTGGRIG